MTQREMSISDQIGIIVSGVLDIPEMADNQLALRFKRYFKIAGRKGQTAWDAPYRDGGFVTTGWRFKPDNSAFFYTAIRKVQL
jgi:hypothetical protein